jgi:cyclopropane fatty-acyl-phospholipid synthase-like methyltransferase
MGESVSAQEIFLQQWKVYQKIVDHNYMFHVEVYDHLHRILMQDAVQPFRLMDIACGDASWTIKAARGTEIAHYCGIDISKPALDLAAEELKALDCPVVLQHGDFVDAVNDWAEPVDVVWIGQSLHHLGSAAKLVFMRRIRDMLGEKGLLVIWEPTTHEREDRIGWIKRFEMGSRPLWAAMTSNEWAAMLDHIRAADYPETAARWHSLGHEAGFTRTEDVFTAPTDLSRVYCFRA